MYALIAVVVLFLAGCTTTHDLGGGRYLVPRTVEERSLFGTNMGFAWIEACDGAPDPKQPGMIYRNCWVVTEKIPGCPRRARAGRSPADLLNAAGLWGLGALIPGGNSTTNNARTIINQSSSSGSHRPGNAHK